MSVTHAQHTTHDESTTPAGTASGTASRQTRRRSDLDHDLVAILGMVAILALTALCFLGQSFLPL